MPEPAAADFSFLSLFLQAHIVVQLVMIGLIAASVWGWAIIIEKSFLFARTRREADDFEKLFWSGQSLDELYAIVSQQRTTSMAALFVAAMREWRRSIDNSPRPLAGVQHRIERVMDVTITREMDRLERRLLFLATVGSTAPFVGLFGTVWGIMVAFVGIAKTQTTSLAVIAPGIAGALLATAAGLAAAIPAVLIYNFAAKQISKQASKLDDFAGEFISLVSRDMDRRAG